MYKDPHCKASCERIVNKMLWPFKYNKNFLTIQKGFKNKKYMVDNCFDWNKSGISNKAI